MTSSNATGEQPNALKIGTKTCADEPALRRRVNPAALFAGVLSAYGLVLLPDIPQVTEVLGHVRFSSELGRGAAAVYALSPIVFLAAIITRWERQPLASAGWRLPTLTEIPPALAGVFSCFLLAYAEAYILFWVFGIQDANPALTSVIERALALPVWARAVAVIWDAMVEECGRGYVIERFETWSGSIFWGACAALAGSMIAHSDWGLKVLYTFLLPQLVLVLLYVWRRNVGTCVIAHSLLDGALFIIAPYFLR